MKLSIDEILIDREDLQLIAGSKWYLDKDGYAFTPKPTRKMHRLILNAKPGEIVDHINGNKLDNRKENLRICNYKQNAANRKISKLNSCGFKGVTFFPKRTSYKKWRTKVAGKLIGYFATKIEAAKAYDSAATKLYGEFAKTNFGDAL